MQYPYHKGAFLLLEKTIGSALTKRDRLMVFGMAFLARAILLVLVTWAGTDLFRWSLDSWEYTATAQSILDGDWGFYMFVLRTPGYPLLLAGLRLLFQLQSPQLVVWLPFQLALSSLGVVFATWIINYLTGDRRLALVAGILMALDPMMVGAETPLLSEALANPTLFGAQFFLLRWFRQRRLRDFGVAVVLLQIAVLTRPAILYFIGILLLVMLLQDWRRWRFALALLVGFSLPVAAWTYRNIHYTGIPTYSTAGVYNLLFYKSVSTEALVTGHTPGDIAWDYALEVETRLGDPDRLNTEYFPVGNYDYLYVNDAARYAVMSDLAREKLFEFHVWHLVKLPYHVFQNFYNNQTIKLPPPLQLALTLLGFGLAGVGLWQWLRRKRPLWQHALVLGTIAYVVLGTAFYLALPANRYMTTMAPHWYLMMALGGVQVGGWIRSMMSRKTQ